jgi:phospholipid/cholesterol/gamma-HCH transport system substrate-binding protein
MASQKIKFTVGLFLTCGIVIALLAFIWLGVSRVFEKGQHYVTYFNESVQGLDVDSSVKYRGVAIGRVESIGVAPDSKLIQVVLKIETGQKLNEDIVAQLKSVGITGSMFVELDQKKEGEADRSPVLGFPSEYPIISSKPSSISELMQGIDDVLNQIRDLDLAGISDKIKLTLDNVNRVMVDADVKTISTNIQTSLKDIGRIVDRERWDGIIASVEDTGQSLNNVMAKADKIMVSVEDAVHSLNTIMDKTDKSIDHAENSLARIEKIIVDKGQTVENAIDDFKLAVEKTTRLLDKGTLLVDNTDDSIYHLSQYLTIIARNLEKASDNLNRLIEQVKDHPSQLLFGEPPAPRKLEE